MHHLNWQNKVPGKVKGKRSDDLKDGLQETHYEWVYSKNIGIFQTSCFENSIYIEIASRYDKVGFMKLSNCLTLLRKSVKMIDFRQSWAVFIIKPSNREGWNIQVDEECGAIMELSDLNLPFIQFQKKDFRRACFFIVKVGSGLGTKISFCPFLWVLRVV